LMARRHALINRLTAVETLGATGVIFTDKTGTLTKNRMTLSRVVTPTGSHKVDEDEGSRERRGEKVESESQSRPEDGGDDPLLRRAIEIGVLCSNASLTDVDRDGLPDEEQGDPTEVALLRAGLPFGFPRDELLEKKPETREEAFDPDMMMMATFHEADGGYEVAVKGAPQAVLEVCTSLAQAGGGDEPKQQELDDHGRKEWIDRAEELADTGLRVLAVADKRVDDSQAEPYEGLRFVGLVALYDPPAEGVEDSIAACQRAGVRVVMVTGDQTATAKAIGRQVGLADEGAPALHGSDLPEEHPDDDERQEVLRTPVFARVSPAQKFQLMKTYQNDGQIVAMTGDGINDAPALKRADIGVAMGRRGTDAARQAADMVLKDDSLGSIVAAIEQGRVIFANIRKSVMFMLCTNVAEIVAVAAATLAGLPLPLKPLQILYLNVLTDVFPALALGVGRGDPRVMERLPRDPKEQVLTRKHWLAIGGWSVLVAASVLGALSAARFGLDFDETAAVTVSFLTLGFAKLWFVLNLRDRGTTLFSNDITRNGWVWGAIALCAALLAAAVYVPGLSTLLKTKPPGTNGWLCLLGMSLLPVVIGQVVLAFRKPAQELQREHN